MTERGRDGTGAGFGDETVSRRYRELACDGSPEGLDQRIRAQARAAVRPRSWIQPLAIAATLALALAIVLETTAPPGDVPEEAPPSAAQTTGEERPAAPAPRSAAEHTHLLAPAAGRARLSGEVRKPEMADDGTAAGPSAAANMNAAEADGASDSPCLSERDSPTAWLECIGDLEAAGDEAAAAAERREFARRYPDTAASPD